MGPFFEDNWIMRTLTNLSSWNRQFWNWFKELEVFFKVIISLIVIYSGYLIFNLIFNIITTLAVIFVLVLIILWLKKQSEK